MTLSDTSRIAVVLLAVIALFAALKLAEAVAAPLMLGLVSAIILSPFTDFLERIGVPSGLNAILGLLVAVVVLASLILLLEPVAERALQAAPRVARELGDMLAGIRVHLTGLSDMTDNVRNAISGENGGPKSPAPSLDVPTIADALTFAPALGAQTLIFAGTLFFFLLTRDEIYNAAAATSHERLTPELLRWAEARVSRYFLTITVINFVFGGCVALALHLIGMPQAVLWGAFAAVMNFILYLGPAVVALCLVVGGALAFDGPAMFLPPAVFIAINITEGQFVTPALIGRQMSLNPLLVFLSLVFWLWLWGPIGGMIAIPLMLWVFAVGAHLIGHTREFERDNPRRAA